MDGRARAAPDRLRPRCRAGAQKDDVNEYRTYRLSAGWIIGKQCQGCLQKVAQGERVTVIEDLDQFLTVDRFSLFHSRCTPTSIDRRVKAIVKRYQETGSVFA